jgi:hypothetical protein
MIAKKLNKYFNWFPQERDIEKSCWT